MVIACMRIDQPRQPRRTAKAGMQSQLNLRETERRIVDCDPIFAGERDLQAAAETIAMDDGDGRQLEPLQPVDNRVGTAETRFDVGRFCRIAKFSNIGAGDKAARLAGAYHQAFRALALDGREDVIKFGHDVFRQRIGASALLIDDQPGDAVLIGLELPIVPRRRGLHVLRCSERSEFQISWGERVPYFLRHGGAPTLSRSAWRHPGHHRYIQWRCRACGRAVSSR